MAITVSNSCLCVPLPSASEQMLYDIYENTIGMIEELEKHEDHGMSAGHSGLLDHIVPPNKKREKHDVSLLAFSHACLPEAKILLLLLVGAGSLIPCEMVGEALNESPKGDQSGLLVLFDP